MESALPGHVGDIDKCDSYFSLNFFQLDLHLLTDFCIQSTKRLIQKKDLRLIDKSSRNGSSLLLAAERRVTSLFRNLPDLPSSAFF